MIPMKGFSRVELAWSEALYLGKGNSSVLILYYSARTLQGHIRGM